MAAGRDEILIRRAEPRDAGALAQIHVRTWAVAYEHIFGAERLARMDVDGRRRQWEEWLARGARGWVAERDDRVVGFVSIGDSLDGPGLGELYAIYVFPEAWGSGAGRGLMAAALDGLRASYHEAVLWVLEDNPRARRFYEREGWSLDGGERTEAFFDVPAHEVRYRISFGAAGRTSGA